MRVGVSTGQFSPHRSRPIRIFELIERMRGMIETGRGQLRLISSVGRRQREQRQQSAATDFFVWRTNVGQAKEEQCGWPGGWGQSIGFEAQLFDRGGTPHLHFGLVWARQIIRKILLGSHDCRPKFRPA
jgi:hypothetical protein